MKAFNVLVWDFNSDALRHYDIMPYLRTCYEQKKDLIPVTRKDLLQFVEREARSEFWGRCEWEMICHGWPVRRNTYKLDVYEQIMMNIDIITEILYEEKRTDK